MVTRFACLALAIVVLAAALACTGDDGAPGTTGVSGRDAAPRAISVLVMGAHTPSGVRVVALGLAGDGGVNPATDIDHLDVSGATPVLADLTSYDAILFYSNAVPSDAIALGNVLADYVDAGGRLLILQGAFSPGTT